MILDLIFSFIIFLIIFVLFSRFISFFPLFKKNFTLTKILNYLFSIISSSFFILFIYEHFYNIFDFLNFIFFPFQFLGKIILKNKYFLIFYIFVLFLPILNKILKESILSTSFLKKAIGFYILILFVFNLSLKFFDIFLFSLNDFYFSLLLIFIFYFLIFRDKPITFVILTFLSIVVVFMLIIIFKIFELFGDYLIKYIDPLIYYPLMILLFSLTIYLLIK